MLSSDAKTASKIQKLVSEENLVFLETLALHGMEIFPEAIQAVSDLILYNPEIHLSEEERDYLFDLKIMRDAVKKISTFSLA